MQSDAVATPGSQGRPALRKASSTLSLKPGLTTACAPASLTCGTCAGVTTVPATASAGFGDRRERLQRRRAAQRHLDDIDAAGDQRMGEIDGARGILDHDHGDHAAALQPGNRGSLVHGLVFQTI
jgi:hypothetical protein